MTPKITTEGQPCRKCGTPVIRKNRANNKVKSGQQYYFQWWYYCPKCHRIYNSPDAKVFVGVDRGQPGGDFTVETKLKIINGKYQVLSTRILDGK